jgi:hypothetical protein
MLSYAGYSVRLLCWDSLQLVLWFECESFHIGSWSELVIVFGMVGSSWRNDATEGRTLEFKAQSHCLFSLYFLIADVID